MVDDSLRRFHPLSQRWFSDKFALPTPAQQSAWPLICEGRHVLVTAPTGSGKTLTAFFHTIDSLLSGRIEADGIRVLYVSPLKALNNDIQKNLTAPLGELKALYASHGMIVPDIRVMTRSGDTPEEERRRMSSHPPSILITTPESLNILITSKRGERLLHGLKTVILDEIHAVADTKRGTYLMTAVERLTLLSGEFQRIALTATVNPLDRIARFVGGYEQLGPPDSPKYRARDVDVVAPQETKSLSIAVCFAPREAEAEAESGGEGENPGWVGAAAAMNERIADNNATLIFANSRRGVERLARLINEAVGDKVVYAHHGSLSKEIRLLVEERLKEGDLQGVVATSSLELGIDIGHIDEVLMLESPPSTAAALQRLGRSGHGVGETSRGTIYVLHPKDALDAALIAREVSRKNVAPISLPSAPLDVLAQVILSICSLSAWPLERLYNHIRCAAPYRDLSRRMFDLVVEMLTGKYEGAKVETLRPRLLVDQMAGTARTLPNVTKLLYRSGGTIPDRGYYAVRLKASGALIGELDEEFVWERKLGDIITLGVQTWRIREITYNDVLVTYHGTSTAQTPFWRCEERGSTAYFADMRSTFLESADAMLHTPAFGERLKTDHFLDQSAADMITHYLRAGKAALGTPLPHRHHLVVEKVAPGTTSRMAITVIHTEWGGKVNRSYAIALRAALSSLFEQPVQTTHDDGAVAVALETDLDPDQLLGLVTAENAEILIRSGIEETGFFGAAFRENAARALLILKAGFGRRTPLWLNRKRAKEMREKLSGFDDFPITLETFRNTLQDDSDIESLCQKLDELGAGVIPVSVTHTPRPSPFAEPVVYKLTNLLMYDDDAVEEGASATSDALIEEVLFSETLRPRIERALIDTIEEKLQRRHVGYAPASPLELLSWIKERLLIPWKEWQALLIAIERDHGIAASSLLPEIEQRVVAITTAAGRFIAAVDEVPMVLERLDIDDILFGHIAAPESSCPAEMEESIRSVRSSVCSETSTLESFLNEWLRFYGPLSIDALGEILPVENQRIRDALAILKQEGEVVIDQVSIGSDEQEVVHTAVFRMLLRAQRAGSRHALSPKPIETLPLFLAETQGLTRDSDTDDIEAAVEVLFGFAGPLAFFEQELLPARCAGYRTALMDALIAGTNLQWVGAGADQIYFCFEEDRELFANRISTSTKTMKELEAIFPDERGRHTVSDLAKRAGISEAELKERLKRLLAKGLVTSESLRPLRQGARAQTIPERPAKPRFHKWRRAEADLSIFYPLPPIPNDSDVLAEEVLNRERAKVLLHRYGVVFKDLLKRELPLLGWSRLFRTLRLMELSQEVVGGYFFEGVSGIQFAAPSAVSRLQRGTETTPVFWINAKDPASLCGMGLSELALPPRIASTHLVYRGEEVVIVSKRKGKYLEIHVPETDPLMPRYLTFIDNMLTRDVAPTSLLTIEKINGRPAASSPYRPLFEALFDTAADHKTLTLARRYGKGRE